MFGRSDHGILPQLTIRTGTTWGDVKIKKLAMSLEKNTNANPTISTTTGMIVINRHPKIGMKILD